MVSRVTRATKKHVNAELEFDFTVTFHTENCYHVNVVFGVWPTVVAAHPQILETVVF